MLNNMFEYLHVRLPIAASDAAAMKQFVKHNHIGTTFVVQDVDSCTAAIKQVLGDGERHRSNVTHELVEEYSWEAQERTIQSVYGRILAEAKPVRPARVSAAMARRLDGVKFRVRYGHDLAQINFNTRIWLDSIVRPILQIGCVACMRYFRERHSARCPLRQVVIVENHAALLGRVGRTFGALTLSLAHAY